MKPDEVLSRVASRRHGVFTTAEAARVGVTGDVLTTRLRRGSIIRAEPGVYRFAAVPTSWEQSVVIGCVAEAGWASHRTAAALWQLDGCRRGIVEIVTRRWKRRPNRSILVHETKCLEEDDVTEIDGIPIVSRERTIVDLGRVLPRERVEMALDTVGIDLDRVWDCVERLDSAGRPWVRVTRRLVAVRLGRDGVAPNVFERRLFTIMEKHGLPIPRCQVEIRRRDGSLIRRVDWLLEATRLVLECDSFLWHGAWRRRTRDLRVDRELTALGYRVLRFTWDDLSDDRAVAADIGGAILAASA